MFEGESYWIAKLLFQRGIALIYLIAFIIGLRQYSGLVGDKGILPIKDFIEDKEFRDVVSIFYFFHSNLAIKTTASAGIILSIISVFGFADFLGKTSYVLIYGSMWMLFLSFKNTGQKFYSSGSCLAEAGFLTIFLGIEKFATPLVLIILIRWFLFRMMFGSGLIKLRHDNTWENLTALDYFYETQSSPNPLSWYFDKLPSAIKKFGVLFSHFTLLIIPFLYFAPQPYASIAGVITILYQLLIFLSGNFYWLNLMTVFAAFFTFSDQVITALTKLSLHSPTVYPYPGMNLVLGSLVAVLSIGPAWRMISSDDFHSKSYSPLRIVNTYGRYPNVLREKREIIFKGLKDGEWREYEFYEKTGPVDEMPPQIAPYSHRLDGMFWFAAQKPGEYEFVDNLMDRLLDGEEEVLKLMKNIPFDEPPEKIKTELYNYRFTTREEKKDTGNWWKRNKIKTISVKDKDSV